MCLTGLLANESHLDYSGSEWASDGDIVDVALAFESKEGGELEHPPRKPSEPIFEHRIIQHVLVTGTVMGVLAFAVYGYLIYSSTATDEARNLTLMLMMLFGNIHALSSRSETRSIFTIRFFYSTSRFY